MTGTPELPARESDAQPAGSTRDFAAAVCDLLEAKRAADVVCLDVEGLTDLADCFVIATILNPRQGRAVVDACEKEAKRRGVSRRGIEGESGSSWVLLDYGDVIVHLFLPDQREYYALEHIWADARRVR